MDHQVHGHHPRNDAAVRVAPAVTVSLPSSEVHDVDTLREGAKFLAGFAAGETIGHLWLGMWGKHLLPMTLGWFTFTESMNAVVMMVWPIVLCTLV
jgi:hypothetical protein